MQYHSINIEKLQKRMKNRFSNIAYQIRWSVGDGFKIIISTKSNAVESNHSDESDIRRIYITFLEKHFSAKVYWPCTKRSKLLCLPLCCYFGERLLCCQYVDGYSVVNVTLNLARRSNTILNRMRVIFEAVFVWHKIHTVPFTCMQKSDTKKTKCHCSRLIIRN